MRDGSIRRVAIDTPEPSPFSRSILNAAPYSFLDDAPLEERRTQAVLSRRVIDDRTADTIGKLDPEAVRMVREQAWPDARDAEEVHEALSWMGYVTTGEAGEWKAWLEELRTAGRVVLEGTRWFAVEATRDPRAMLRGRMEALGPVVVGERIAKEDEPLLFELEREGAVMRIQLDGTQAWCDRRLLARIQRLTLETLRREIEPVQASDFLRFLGVWQSIAPDHRLSGPTGVLEVIGRLAGWEAPTAAWERKILEPRIEGYRPEWLDQLAFAGQLAWGRLWGASRAALRATPIALVPRTDLDTWLALSSVRAGERPELSWQAERIGLELESRGALFMDDLTRASGGASPMMPNDVERGLEELIASGRVTSDSFMSLRQLLRPAYRRKSPVVAAGRWSLLPRPSSPAEPDDETAEFVARRLLDRYGVIFRAMLERERQPIPWRLIARVCRRLELRGDIRGGRFVASFSGEQFALPRAVKLVRKVRRDKLGGGVSVAACDPLNLEGVLTPGERVSSRSSDPVRLA